MEEKKEVKISLGTIICIIIIIILLLAIGGMYYYYNFIKGTKQNINNEMNLTNITSNSTEQNIINAVTTETNNKENSIAISLSNTEKVSINKKLSEQLLYALRAITNDEIDKMEYNVDLLKSKENKAQMLWYAMKAEGVNFSEYNKDGEAESGRATIDIATVKEYYNKIFEHTTEQEFQELLNVYSKFGYFTVTDEKIYGAFPTGWGIDTFELKINSINLDTLTNKYTAVIDVLRPKNSNEDELNDMIVKYSKNDVLEWPNELNYAKLNIEYNKDSNGNYKLISLMLTK